MKKTPEVTSSLVTVPPEIPKTILKTVLPIAAKKTMELIQEKMGDKTTKSKRKPRHKKKKSKSLFTQSKKRRR